MDNFQQVCKREIKIEQDSMPAIKKWLNDKDIEYTFFDNKSLEHKHYQIDFKVDGQLFIDNKKIWFECKTSANDWPDIFAEHHATSNKTGRETPGWATRETSVWQEPTILFYKMPSKLFIYKMVPFKKWYKQEKAHLLHRLVNIQDKAFDQTMYGHKIPLQTMKQFLIEEISYV